MFQTNDPTFTFRTGKLAEGADAATAALCYCIAERMFLQIASGEIMPLRELPPNPTPLELVFFAAANGIALGLGLAQEGPPE